MKFWQIILIYTFSCSTQLQALSFFDNGKRIIGGNVATSGQFPFVAAINVLTTDTTFFCGGALLNTEWIVTSATCLYQSVALNISLGSTSLTNEDPNRILSSTSDIFTHPEFDPVTLENDIGVVKLSEEVEFSNYVQPIKLTTINLPTILTPTALGWGQTSDKDDSLASDLQYVTLRVLKNEDCASYFGSQIKDTMVCVKGSNNEGACYGDSGSPLVVRPIGSSQLQLVGVSSFFGAEGCENEMPSGYTKTYHYLDWIRNVTENI